MKAKTKLYHWSPIDCMHVSKGCLSLFHHFIDMRAGVNLSTSRFFYMKWTNQLSINSLFHHSIDMRTAIDLSISCRKNVFLLEIFKKTCFFLHEVDKLTAVLMSIE